MFGNSFFYRNVAVVAILLALACPAFAGGQKGKKTATTALTTWSKHCGAAKSKSKKSVKTCAAVHVIKDKRGRKVVSFMATRLNTKPYLEVVVPLGIFLPFGVRLQVDKNDPWATETIDCTREGCRSFLSLNKQQIADLQEGSTLRVIFKDSKSQKPLLITGSLAGFASAFAL